jgi:hypothetical protein
VVIKVMSEVPVYKKDGKEVKQVGEHLLVLSLEQ